MPKMIVTAHISETYSDRKGPEDFTVDEQEGTIHHKVYGKATISPEDMKALLDAKNKVPVLFGGRNMVLNPMCVVEDKSLMDNIFGFCFD